MAVKKIKIDLDFVRPGMSFMYPLYSERGDKVLDERMALSEEKIAKIRELHGNIVYYTDAGRRSTIPGYRIKIACNTARDILGEITKSEKISRSSLRTAESLVEGILSDLSSSEIDTVDLLKDFGSYDDYLHNHLVNVGILSAVFARTLGSFNDDELRDITLGAFLHDIGQNRIDRGLLEKEGRLDTAEMQKVKRHPQLGYEMLKGLEKTNAVVLQSVLFHHEKFDNNGYYELPYENLPLYPKIISICDTYDALTSKRPYRKEPLGAIEAMKAVFNSSRTLFDDELAESFVTGMSPFLAPGAAFFSNKDVCELNTQELALVRSQGKTSILKPGLLVFCRFVREGGKIAVKFYEKPYALDLEKDAQRKIRKILNNPTQLRYIREKLAEHNIM